MEKVLQMTYASSLTDICSMNSSFDRGVLRIAYHGDNQNKSSISKSVFDRCAKTMYNCPVVCNYDRETDTLGGHDIELVRDSDGGLRIVNATNPVGVIPEAAKIWWDVVEEDDGTEHEYLFTEVLLWKRQEAYRKIKKDGITSHSMEITVKDCEMIDGILNIYDFEFTAFALIGVTPCFESSALEMYSTQDFKKQLSEMMHDLKDSFQLIDSPNGDEDKHTQQYSTEGGEEVLQGKTELAAKYGVDVESLDFSLEDYTEEELIEKFEAMKSDAAEDGNVPEQNDEEEQSFALTSNVVEEIYRSLSAVKIEREWGQSDRFLYVDCDFDANEVYCWDTSDWLLYGFTYTVDGDSVVIDFDSKKRKKYVIADFDEGEQDSPFAPVFASMEQLINDGAQWEAKYQTASETIANMEIEMQELRQFKDDTEKAQAEEAIEEVFSKFEDLVGIEAFDDLRANHDGYDAESLEEKCYAIRGRNGITAKFSREQVTPKIKVPETRVSDEPYGGLMAEYGFTSNN